MLHVTQKINENQLKADHAVRLLHSASHNTVLVQFKSQQSKTVKQNSLDTPRKP